MAFLQILLVKNADFNEKRRLCECATMLTLLIGFTLFSLYVVFAHGFHFGEENPFSIVQNRTKQFIKEEVREVQYLVYPHKYDFYANFLVRKLLSAFTPLQFVYRVCNNLLEQDTQAQLIKDVLRDLKRLLGLFQGLTQKRTNLYIKTDRKPIGSQPEIMKVNVG